MATYLKKKNLYEIVKNIMAENGKEIPIMKNCEYKFYHGMEWLNFTGVREDYQVYKVCAEACGNRMSIEAFGHKPYEQESSLLRREVYSGLQSDGTYLEHSVRTYDEQPLYESDEKRICRELRRADCVPTKRLVNDIWQLEKRVGKQIDAAHLNSLSVTGSIEVNADQNVTKLTKSICDQMLELIQIR